MRHTWEKSHHHAEGHSAGAENKRRLGRFGLVVALNHDFLMYEMSSLDYWSPGNASAWSFWWRTLSMVTHSWVGLLSLRF